jgi:hypothetical protein
MSTQCNLNLDRYDVEISYVPTIVFETNEGSKSRKPTFYRKYTVSVKDKLRKAVQCYRFTLKE